MVIAEVIITIVFDLYKNTLIMFFFRVYTLFQIIPYCPAISTMWCIISKSESLLKFDLSENGFVLTNTPFNAVLVGVTMFYENKCSYTYLFFKCSTI